MIKKLWNKLVGTPKNAISFKSGMDLTELPVVTLYQGDKRFNFLLDTGSNDSIIDKNIINEIEHSVIEGLQSNLIGLEGNLQKTEICSIELSYKDEKYKHEYLICDMKDAFGHIKKTSGVTLHGIIGSKFFNKFRYVLDFAELIAYSKK